MPHWGMVIDLRKCIGCATCKEVCDQSDERPLGVLRTVIEKQKNHDDGQKEKFFMTMSCMHCENPPCQDTCPTGATYRRPDGIMEIRGDLCIGCRACILACPYRARVICTEDVIGIKELVGQDDREESDSDRIGICTKCNFCSQIVDAGLQKKLKPGVDSDATPVCVRACIAEALYFGDLDDKESKVSKLVQENKTIRLLEEMGTDPSIYYILK